MKQVFSPNFNDRDPSIGLDYIVLHYTGMKDAESAMMRMCDPNAEVSAHYVIGEDGGVTQLVVEKNRAWHAGKSFWRGQMDMNSASIGIELINPGHEFGYRAFPAAQISALKPLLREIIARHDMNPVACLLGHSDIAIGRRFDPGELFPWRELAREGLGLWPEITRPGLATEAEMAALLKAIGYDVVNIHETLLAFQRRFQPGNVTGFPNTETAPRLRAVKQRMCD